MRPDLLGWQWGLYDANHTTRATLVVHLLTVPLFQAGTLALLATPVSPWLAPSGLVAMLFALAAQGRAHRAEPKAPEPFLGPVDAITRLLAEQWITFPRFVLTGGVARAWRGAAASPPSG